MAAVPRLRIPAAAVLVAAWGLAVATGFAFLLDYEHRPGAEAQAPVAWPAGAPVEPALDRPTLLLFAHPLCPCTRATLEELDRVLAQSPRKPRVHVCFFQDSAAPPEWSRTDLWEHATRLPGVEVHADPEGAIARAFGARTSGQVLVYDAAGALLFCGGITVSRGHAGDNRGMAAVRDLLNDRPAACADASVFGCALFAGDLP